MIYRLIVEVECEDDAAQPSPRDLTHELESLMLQSSLVDDVRVSDPSKQVRFRIHRKGL